MTDRFYKELKKSSLTNPSFQVLINGEWVVCNNIEILPYKDTTLGKYLLERENAYNDKLEALQEQVNKQQLIINELVKAIKTLNGGA